MQDSAAHYPHRIYLDTSVLQTIEQSGGSIWENQELKSDSPLHRLQDGAEDVESLRRFFRVAERGSFQFIVSSAAIEEVRKGQEPALVRWVHDVRHHSEVCLAEEPPSEESHTLSLRLDSDSYGYLSAGDRALLQEAVALECDTFLTMERSLPKQADHLFRTLRIMVMRPPDLWATVRRYPH